MPENYWVPCQVETYSGARLHERPRRFTRGAHWLEVRQILDRWRDPQQLHFKVVAEDRRIYLLSYHFLREAWAMQPLRNLD